MFQKYFLLAFALLFSLPTQAQWDDDPVEEKPVEKEAVSRLYWGFKGGLTLATQKWNTFQHQVMPTYHGDFFVEYLGKWSETKTETTGALYPFAELVSLNNHRRKPSGVLAVSGVQRRFGAVFSLGYHQRGGTYRVWNIIGSKRPKDVFHNISLLLGGKGQFRVSNNWLVYYGLGLRGEITPVFNMASAVMEPYARRLNYGVWFAGGAEFMLAKTSIFFEVSLSPDVSKQVLVPQGSFTGFNDQITGLPILFTLEKVYNLSFEVSMGIKFGRTGVEKKEKKEK